MQELKRVYRNPFWYIAFVVLAVINIVLYLIVQKDNIFCSFNEYSSIDSYWQDKIADKNTDEAISLLEDEKSILMSLSRVLAQIEVDDLEAVDAYVLENPKLAGYISDLKEGKDLLLRARVYYIDDYIANLKHIETYPGYLSGIKIQAELMKKMLSKEDSSSFELKNIDKTVRDFANMEGYSYNPGNNNLILSVINNDASAVFMVLMMLVTVFLFFDERRMNLNKLVVSSPAGRSKLFFRRAGIIVFSAILITSVFYISLILSSFTIYSHSADLSRLVQSIPLFMYFPEPISLGKFLFLFGIYRALGLILSGMLFWVVFMWIRNRSISFVLMSLVYLSEYILFIVLNKNYALGWLSSINIFTMISTRPVFSRYVNLSIFGNLVIEWKAVLYAMVFLILLLSALCLIGHVILRYIPRSSELPLLSKMKVQFARLKHVELKKVFIYCGGVIIVAVLFFTAWKYIKLPQIRNTLVDEFVENFSTKYSGPVSQDTLDLLEDDLKSATEEYEVNRERALYDKTAAYELEYAYARIKALNIVIERAKMIYETGKDNFHLIGINAYENVFGITSKSWRLEVMALAMFFLILLVSHEISYEKKSDMLTFLQTLPRGKNIITVKTLLSILIAVIVWSAITCREIYLVYERWGGFQGLISSGLTLSVWEESIKDIPVIIYISVIYLTRLIALISAAMVALYISSVCDTYIKSILVSFGILLVPALIASLPDMGFVSYFSYTTQISNIDIIPNLVRIAVFVAIGCVATIETKRQWRRYKA
jgi:hypothetical protein